MSSNVNGKKDTNGKETFKILVQICAQTFEKSLLIAYAKNIFYIHSPLHVYTIFLFLFLRNGMRMKWVTLEATICYFWCRQTIHICFNAIHFIYYTNYCEIIEDIFKVSTVDFSLFTQRKVAIFSSLIHLCLFSFENWTMSTYVSIHVRRLDKGTLFSISCIPDIPM